MTSPDPTSVREQVAMLLERHVWVYSARYQQAACKDPDCGWTADVDPFQTTVASASYFAHLADVLAGLLRAEPVDGTAATGCDVCGAPSTRTSTPGGFRFCDDHGGGR